MKIFLKIFFIFSIILYIIGLSKNVSANSINKISMDIFVDNNGDAVVQEVWDCYTNQGTEVYHPYYNLGKSRISDISVTEKGRTYTTLSSWDTSESFENKAYKCGINKISNGVELCWGISGYGSHTYTVRYTITNLVSQLDDCQMLYWTFIPYDFSDTIGKAYIKIHSNFKYNDDWDVWGYGNYGGTCYFYDGYIEMESDGSLAKDEYMTMLAKFPDGTFNTSNKLSHDFNYYFKMAEEGTTHYKRKGIISSIISGIISIIASILPTVLPIILIIIFGRSHSSNLDFGESGKKIPKDSPYYRDIPCNGDLLKAYYIGYNYDIVKNKTDLLGAIILKWMKEGLIRLEKVDKTGIFSKETTSIVLKDADRSKLTDSFELEMFRMMMEASEDGILEDKEFERWCRKHYSKILSWFDDILTKERVNLVNEGLITVEERGKVFKHKAYVATANLKQEAINLEGLKKFLKDYTLIKERGAIEVTLFEEYLIYAQMMGIAKEVANNFKELYPEIIEQSQYSSYDNIMFVHVYSSRGVSSATSAKQRAESYSSGGGGFSSGGGRRRILWWRRRPEVASDKIN